MYFQRVQFTVKLNTIIYELNKNQNTKMSEELLLKTGVIVNSIQNKTSYNFFAA